MAKWEWYQDSITDRYRATHNTDPATMTPHQLGEAITYVRQGQLSCPYTIELCRRAGLERMWKCTRTRRRAMYEAAKYFGFVLM